MASRKAVGGAGFDADEIDEGEIGQIRTIGTAKQCFRSPQNTSTTLLSHPEERMS
jgi:hypothetical protein